MDRVLSPSVGRDLHRPAASAWADIAVRIGVCSAAASLFSEAIWPSGHAAAGTHGSAVAAEVGSAVLLSLLFVCVWDPLKERMARTMLRAEHGHGEPVGLAALLLMVTLGAGLVWVHTVLHHHIEHDVGQAFGAAIERGLIVVLVCVFWFSDRAAIWMRCGLAVVLVGVIMFVGQALLRAGITHEGWTPSEIAWTAVPCLTLLLAERYFRPWRRRSTAAAGWAVLAIGAAVIGLTAVVHGLDRLVPLPEVLLYSSTVGNAHDWAGTMLDDLFFYGGWAGGLLIAPDISDEH